MKHSKRGLLGVFVMIFAGGCISPSFINTAQEKTSPTGGSNLQNRNPIIKTLVSHRFERSPHMATLWIAASDPDRDPVSINWSATEGLLSSTTGTEVMWSATATKSTPYVVTVQSNISDGRGGTASGALNLNVSADGIPILPLEATASMPTPDPADEEQAVGSSPTPGPTAISFHGRVSWRGDGSKIKVGVYRLTGSNNFYNRLNDLVFMGGFRRQQPVLEATTTPNEDGDFSITALDKGEKSLALFIRAWWDSDADGHPDEDVETDGQDPDTGLFALYAFCRAPDEPISNHRLAPGYYRIDLDIEPFNKEAFQFAFY